MKIKILGHEYELFSKNIKKGKDGSRYMGLCDVENGIITVQSNRSKTLTDEAILHEIIHVIEISNGLELEEFQVATLSTCLYAVIRDNKQLIEKMLCS